MLAMMRLHREHHYCLLGIFGVVCLAGVVTIVYLLYSGSITWLGFHKDRLLLSAGEDGQVCVWRCGGGWDLTHSLTGHK